MKGFVGIVACKMGLMEFMALFGSPLALVIDRQ